MTGERVPVGHLVVHVVTGRAVGLGDPAVIVTCDDGGGDAKPWLVEVFRWLPGPGEAFRPSSGEWLVVNGEHERGVPDLDGVLAAVGWRRLPHAAWRLIDDGYHLAAVERQPSSDPAFA